MTARPLAIVVGYIIRYPLGGMTWVFMNHLHGLRQLGFDVVFMEAAGYQPTCFDPKTLTMTADPTAGVRYIDAAFDAHGLGGTRWWYADPELPGGGCGLTREDALAALDTAVVLVNIGGSCWSDEFSRAARRILVDTDAPFTQIRLSEPDEYWRGVVEAHDTHATYAVNLVAGSCDPAIPDAGIDWIATRPPIHTAEWPVADPTQGRWTTVTSWDSYGSRWWQLEEWRQKDIEYSRLKSLPSLVPELELELALGGPAPRSQLIDFGWKLTDPLPITQTPRRFMDYIATSRGELAVQKQAFIRGRTGAFNDRSLCYLASGRPVVCSDTGIADWLPVGEGVLTYTDAQSAAEALRVVEHDTLRHSRSARRLAEEHFEAAKVTRALLEDAGVPLP